MRIIILNKAGQIRLYYHADGCNSITVTSLVGATINSITATYGELNNNNAVVTVGGNTVTDTNDADQTGEYVINNSSFTIRNGYTSNVQLYILSIVINYTAAGSVLNASDLALTDAPIALNFDLYNNASAQVINYTTSSTGAVTIEDNEYATFVINESAKTITVTPTAVTPSSQTITVNQAADATYDVGSTTFTLNITDSTPIPTHTATFSVNGAITSQDFKEGAAITFPSDPAAIGGNTFVGWYTSTYSDASVAPAFVNTATETMGDKDVTYYAVFATASVGDTPTSLTITPSTANFPTSYGSANTFTEYTLEGKKFKIQQGYINGGKMQWRAAGNSNGTGTIYNNEALTKITSVVLTYNSSDTNQNFTLKIGNTANPTSGTSITPTNSSLVSTYDCSAHEYDYFVLTNGSGAGYLDEITINYTSIGTVYSDYCTTVVPPSVATPVISVTSPFTFSTAVTMSCETVGATIYYTLDGTDPTAGSTEYTASFDINATTTIKAIAIKDANASSVATVTATKNLAEPTVTINAAGITNTDVYTGTAAGSLSASVTYNEAPVGGATVTWSSSDEDVATIAADGTVTLVGAGSVTFTATYAGNGDYSEKTATYEMTVTSSAPYVQPTDVTITFNNTLIGVSAGSNTSSNVDVSVDNVQIQMNKISGNNYPYGTASEVRWYNETNLIFSAPSGYFITDIVFAKGSKWNADKISADNGYYVEDTTPYWTGQASSITFDITGTVSFTTATVTLAPYTVVGSAGYTTYVTPVAVEFTNVTAYIVTAVGGSSITLSEVDSAPANTPVIIEASANTYAFTATDSPASVSGNQLQPSDGSKTGNGLNIYALGKKSDVVGFYLVNDGQTIPAGKAYIVGPNYTGVKEFLTFSFEDDADGLERVQDVQEVQGAIFNLAGQRLSKMQKGINIVNGKKILY